MFLSARGVGGDVSCALRCACATRVARRGGDVFVGDGAPFCARAAGAVRRGCLGGPARACGASARRHSQLHRWEMQRLHTRRGAAILHPISQRAARIEGMALCTRARRVRIARRGDRTVNYVRAMPGQQTVRRCDPPGKYGCIRPKQRCYGSRRRHTSNRTRGTRSRHTAASTERLRVCSGTDAAATR